MPLSITPLPFKPPRLIGLSEALLASHYKNNYGGALRRLNSLEDRIARLDLATTAGFELNGLKREELIAANSVILHEVYFDALGGADGLGSPSIAPSDCLGEALVRDFGSLERWRDDFAAMGKALAGGSGWVVLSWSERRGRLINSWACDHAHNPADGAPILALDMYEHAYHLDFGADAGAYVDTFMANIHWDRPERRYRRAVGLDSPSAPKPSPGGPLAPEALKAWLDRGEDLVLLDICLAEDMAKRHDLIPGALVRPPEEIGDWISTLPRDKPIVAYCVYGFQVSGNAVKTLRAQGYDARSLSGGIAAWHAIGGPTTPLD